MGQKTNPIGNRLGIIRGWESSWYGSKKDFAEKLMEDSRIREYLKARIQKGGISKLVIERTLKRIIVTIHTSRPGLIIGNGGGEVDRIKEELKKVTSKDIQINIVEIRRPELDAQIIADTIAKQIESRINFKRAMKMSVQSTMRMGAEGIKIKCGGRLGGAEIARTEEVKQGRVPLHTFRADVDYAHAEALTVYGIIGIKVWVCRGDIYGKRDLNMNFGTKADNNFVGQEGGGERRGGFDRNDRRGGGDRGGRGGERRGGAGGGDRRGGNAGGRR